MPEDLPLPEKGQSCSGLNICVLPKFMLKPNSQGEVLGGGIFGRSLDRKDGVLLNGVSAVIKENPSPFHHVRIQWDTSDTDEGPRWTMLAP